MDFKIRGKPTLVSRSTKCVGRAVATGLAGEGARVIADGRTEKSVTDAQSMPQVSGQ
jgi:hypothetical protein